LGIPIPKQGLLLTCGPRSRCLLEAEYFLRGLHGTQTHVDTLMLALGWRKEMVTAMSEPNLELFLWAILTGNAEMALIFWRRQGSDADISHSDNLIILY
jgi:hypothetical protein